MTAPNTLPLRAATEADLDDLVALRVLMFEAMGTSPDALAAPEWLASSRSWFASVIAHDDALVLVGETGGRVLAGGVAEVRSIGPSPGCPNGCSGIINNIVTRVDARGQGWGARITQALVAWLDTETDATRIDLFATPEGASIYRGLGFAEVTFPAMQRPSPARER